VTARPPLTLDDAVAGCPAEWSIARVTQTITEGFPAYLDVWRVAVRSYSVHRSPYGNSPHGVLRFFQERRG
jgi:hypothetical protein